MSQEIIQCKIETMDDNGGIVITAIVPSVMRALVRKYQTVEIGLCDGRSISPEQRKKIYALLAEISDYVGDDTESTKRTMKMDFVMNRMQAMQRKMFSLSDVDMNTASEFISYLVEFILEHDIPCQDNKLSDLCEDIGKYVYACLMNKKCCVCGSHADLHHHDEKIGAGRDRDKILQIGMGVLPLCREHHTLAHTMGKQEFLDKFHLQTVGLTKEIGKKYGLTKKNLGD